MKTKVYTGINAKQAQDLYGSLSSSELYKIAMATYNAHLLIAHDNKSKRNQKRAAFICDMQGIDLDNAEDRAYFLGSMQAEGCPLPPLPTVEQPAS